MNSEITPEIRKRRKEKRKLNYHEWVIKNPDNIRLKNKISKSKEHNPEYYERERIRNKKNSDFKSEYLKFKRAIPWFLTN